MGKSVSNSTALKSLQWCRHWIVTQQRSPWSNSVYFFIYLSIYNLENYMQIYKFARNTCRSPCVVHGAYESALVIHSRITFWNKERTVATQPGSLITAELVASLTEKSSESKQDEFHKTCICIDQFTSSLGPKCLQ